GRRRSLSPIPISSPMTLAFPRHPAASPGYGRSSSVTATWRCSPGRLGAGKCGGLPTFRVADRTTLPERENDQPRSDRLVGVARPDRGGWLMLDHAAPNFTPTGY